MPRIPTSKPQNVAQRAGLGGKINPTSLSGFFGQVASASAEASEAIRRADEEKQKLIEEVHAGNCMNGVMTRLSVTDSFDTYKISILR